MALGALIGANGEGADGRHALVPLGGRPLIDMQVRLLAAQGAMPIVIYPEVPDPDLERVVANLRGEGFPVVLADDGAEAAARFSSEDRILLVGDGIVPEPDQLSDLAARDASTILYIPDDGKHDDFERIDLERRWAGLALADGGTLGATAAMVGDWDLVSTLLRRLVQAKADMVALDEIGGQTPLRVETAADTAPHAERLRVAARSERRDWLSRFVLAPLEDMLVEQAAGWKFPPRGWHLVGLTAIFAGAATLAAGWHYWAAVALILALLPDLVGRQVARRWLRGQEPIFHRLRQIACLILAISAGWYLWPTWGWPIAMLGAALVIFARSLRIERVRRPVGERWGLWLFHWRPALAIVAIAAIVGQLFAAFAGLALYAALSFILVHWRSG
ncbi:hypothetical protein [Sphingomicrobium sediminis]|uniref:Uncharacterized protein n=1 Tax=Sphingomicrobium sediminis TaxID=2950949 RepID=A0A9X2EKG2_9SPHN|nr:hypothetical protein [Sphingomicrobium sediminis]MCM8557012.1 hypothetical protein [Sphingomicrobium sediminis]